MTNADIIKIRLNSGKSQDAISQEIGVSRCTWNRWENGKTKPLKVLIPMLQILARKYEREAH